jgi:hypothetical protein
MISRFLDAVTKRVQHGMVRCPHRTARLPEGQQPAANRAVTWGTDPGHGLALFEVGPDAAPCRMLQNHRLISAKSQNRSQHSRIGIDLRLPLTVIVSIEIPPQERHTS